MVTILLLPQIYAIRVCNVSIMQVKSHPTDLEDNTIEKLFAHQHKRTLKSVREYSVVLTVFEGQRLMV
jgi:hypothetical protein